MQPSLILFAAMAVTGAGVMGVTWSRAGRAAPDIGEFLDGLGYETVEEPPATPLTTRLLGGASRALTDRMERLIPANYLKKVDAQLKQAGSKRRAGQQLAIQLVLGAAGLAVAPLVPAGTPAKRLMALLLLPVMGFVLPATRLKRAIRARSDKIFKDLPDIVDMLAISVEAGCGFEAALSLVCENFVSPLTDELAMALQEMQLGLSRRQALQQLRDRVDLDAVRILVLSLLQADALGIPIGRVLKSQATEVRARRRAWAREKAARLPVKIMFPLVLFIFPPIMALVLGPAAGSFGKLGS
jgi:tight adherence protein C